MDSKSNILLGLLSHHGEEHPQMRMSLDALVKHSIGEGIGLAVKREYGSMICKSRNAIVERALEMGASHVMFIDSDMVFDPDAMMRLLAHDKDIVSGLCVNRGEPYAPVIKRRDENDTYRPIEGLENGGLFDDVHGVGTAFLLTKTEVFKGVPKPWFAMPSYVEMLEHDEMKDRLGRYETALKSIVKENKTPSVDRIKRILEANEFTPRERAVDTIGEDYYFCHKALKNGFKIFCDADCIIGHIGEVVLTMQHYLDYKEQRDKS